MKHVEASGGGPTSASKESMPPSLAGRIGLFLGPALFALVMLWPDLPLSGDQRRVAAVTLWTACWWMTVALPIGVTSILPAALLPLTGVMGARDVAPLYMHDMIFLFLGAFIIALGLERWNVHRRMAFWIIARVGTRPRNLVLGFMTAAAFLSMWINNTSTTLMLLPIGVAVVASLEDSSDATSPFAMSLLLGMAYAASIGGTSTLIGTPPNQVFAGMLTELFPEAPTLQFGSWLVAWLPLVLLFLPVGWWILTRVALRVPKEGRRGAETIDAERARLGPMAKGEILMSIIFVATALLWITRGGLDLGFWKLTGWVELVVPDSVEQPGRFITDATVATVMAILCFLIPVDRKRGVYLMDWRTAERMPWEVLLLLGAGFVIAGAFRSSGLDRVLGEGLGPYLGNHSDWVVVAAIVFLMAGLTEVTSNTATTVVLLPVLGQAAVAAGISPLFTMMPATIAASAAFMLPVATPPNAVVFSSRRIPAPSMARVGLYLNLATGILIVLVFQLWVRRVLDIELALPEWARKP